MEFAAHVEELAYAHQGPVSSGLIREKPEYFCVEEELSFEPSGEGEHVFLYVQKINLNTADIIKILAKHAGVTRRSVSYAGMKDRHAITKQWFSVQLPGQEGPDWSLLETPQIKVLQVTRHLRKLKRGAINSNGFEIVVSNLNVDTQAVNDQTEKIKQRGVPNYFMEQRFGYLCQNLSRAYSIFEKNQPIKDKKLKGLLLSSVRSYLFNLVLSQRVKSNTWDAAEEGDAFMLNGTRQFFQEALLSNELCARIKEHDIHPTGPLFGVGDSVVKQGVYDIEQRVYANNAIFCEGLIKVKLESSRRALRVVPEGLELNWLEDDKLQLCFKLPSGSYATAVIRELLTTSVQRAG
ncbi:MAG: tRNA pseudouridine(13) synthase TruD [Cycloclasticus sp.]|nr:MAG: tRNA pseudouridine(13) synthase TruD [Cycloclasticus sp.]